MARTYEIHPAIGIARVGKSNEFFLGAEPGVGPPSQFRDESGRLKRQAARFRVFECERNDTGNLVSARELNPAEAQVTWTVHLANRKGAAKRFAGPGFRNNATPNNDAANAHLLIDPGPRSLTGPNQAPVHFDTGKFMGVTVPLGAAHTDGDGRLVVVGGEGTSDSVPPQPNPNRPIQNFADSDGWFDDISDGPVRALVRLTGSDTPVEAKAAWVIVGPPDFAPEVYNLITLYNVAYQVALDRGWLQPPAQPSFTRHIRPILERAVGYQWVNRNSRLGHSGNRPGNFGRNWAALANPATAPPIAQRLLERLRDPRQTPAADPPEPDEELWMPRLHDETNSRKVLPLTRIQYEFLLHWADGDFINDLNEIQPPEPLPDALVRLALESCSGGAFFPGIEAGRIMKEANRYVEPFRLNADPAVLKPGQITEGNALPWQADFYACQWEQHGTIGIGWWPAQRPDHVLPESAPTLPQDWDRGISGDLGDNGMVKSWHKLGIVARRTTPDGKEIFVETERTF